MEKRFEITQYDCLIDNKEKNYICDFWDLTTSPKIIVDLLNEQDEKIEEFEQIMKKHNITGLTKLDACLADYLNVESDTLGGKIIKQQREKIKELERKLEMSVQSQWYIDLDRLKNNKDFEKLQNQKAIEVLERMRNYFDDKCLEDLSDGWIITNRDVVEYTDNQIAELRGKENG